jgi:hypothetical protein
MLCIVLSPFLSITINVPAGLYGSECVSYFPTLVTYIQCISRPLQQSDYRMYHWLKNLKETPFFLQCIHVFSTIFKIIGDYSLELQAAADICNRNAGDFWEAGTRCLSVTQMNFRLQIINGINSWVSYGFNWSTSPRSLMSEFIFNHSVRTQDSQSC